MKGIAARSRVAPFAALAVAVTAFACATSAVAQPDPRPGSTQPVQIMGPLPVPVIGAVSGQVSLAPGALVNVNNAPGLKPYQEFFSGVVPAPGVGATFTLAQVPA